MNTKKGMKAILELNNALMRGSRNDHDIYSHQASCCRRRAAHTEQNYTNDMLAEIFP